MPRNPASFAKRQRELARQRKRAEKSRRREERRDRRPADGDQVSDVDPDIAGIIPGPQPKPEDEEDVAASEE